MAVNGKNMTERFDCDQMAEIQAGKEAGVDVSRYAKEIYMAIQMRQLRIGLQNGIDITPYENPEYDWFQMEEIRLGLEHGLNIHLYEDKALPYDRMRQIRKGLEEGIDLSGFYQLDAKLLRELRKALVSNIDMLSYIKQGYGAEQLAQIRHALQKKLDIAPFLQKEFRGASIQEIAKGLEGGVDVSCYARIEYSWQEMREIRLGLEHRIDIMLYANPLYNWRQMCEIRLGLEEGLDVNNYRSLMYPAADMRRMRLQMLSLARRGEAGHSKSLEENGFLLTVSEDEMAAYIQINREPERETSCADMLQFLKQNGIVSGIMEAELVRMLQQKAYGQPVLVAKGEPARKGKDGWYEFFFDTEPDRTPKLLEDGSVDYRNIKWFEVVTKGQKLACYHAAEAGCDGFTVTGHPCVARRGREAGILRGRGFCISEDKSTYTAGITGKIELSDSEMTIESLLVVDEVTLATGNVEFDGCVYIRGSVGSKTEIRATGDITIDGTVEGAVIESGGSVLLRKGMNGGREGSVDAKKNVTGGFFESVRVRAGEDILANYCLNCELYAKGNITLSGRRGTLAGGKAYAGKGITAYRIGNDTDIRTEITLGVNEEIIQKKRNLEKALSDNRKETQILRNAYMDFERKYTPEVRNTMELYMKLENAVYTKEKQAEQLMRMSDEVNAGIEVMEKAQAVIPGTLYGGTVVWIEGMRWHTKEEVKNVRIKKAQGRIAVYAN